MTPPPHMPAKGLRISCKTGFHIDFTVLAEFHIHDVVVIALDHHCLSRTPNEPQAAWNTSSTSIDQKTKSITNSQSKDIRYGVPASEIHWNSILWWCHLESFAIWAKHWSHGGVAESLSLFKWYSTPSMWSPEKSHQRLSNMFHITNNHKKPYKRLPKEGRIQDTPNKKLKMSDHLQRWPSKFSKDVTLGESLTFNTENTQPQGIPNPVSGVYKSHPSDQQWQWTLQPLSYGHSLWYVHHPYDAKFHDLPPSRRHKWAKILVPSWQFWKLASSESSHQKPATVSAGFVIWCV